MASFDDIAQVTTFKTYKAALKTALAKVRTGSDVPFVYVEKFPFDDKERAMVLVDFAPTLVNELPKKPTVKAKFSVNEADKFVFEQADKMNLERVAKLLSDAGVPRAVAFPGEAETSSPPVASKLDMQYGWTEVRSWGAEARDLIDAFDGLVGIYKGMPEIKPEWADLTKRHAEVKIAMAKMVASKIANDKDVRLKKLEEVKALTKEVRHLSTEARERANAPKPQAKATSSSSQPVKTPVQEAPNTVAEKAATQEPPKPQGKPKVEVADLKSFVKANPALGQKDTLEKYVARAKRALENDFSGVTSDHLIAVEKLAEAMYFKSSEKPSSPTSATPRPVAEKIDWATRVLDVNGRVADLSGFNSTERNKILDIAMTDGDKHHGNTILSGSHGECLHWRLGDLRIFGSVKDGYFTLVGTGRHSGKGNANYKVDLLLGGTATATTD